MRDHKNHTEPYERISTGVVGLDRLLNGGFLRGGTYLLMGPPGSGKTILANQICFHTLAQGGRAVYLTLLAESHTRMFGHLQPLHFFNRNLISDSVQYMSGYNILEKDGLDGLMRLLGEMTRKHDANLLFIDGVASADELAGSPSNFKKFVHNLNSVIGLSGATTFLLSSLAGEKSQPEHTMVDGIVHLNLCHERMRTVREIEVQKFRGSDHMSGRHFFTITNEGLTVFPRIEALVDRFQPNAMSSEQRVTLGSTEFDDLLGGGLRTGSVTSLLGPAGTGKTTLGMKFLEAGAAAGEKCLLFSLYEHPNRLLPKLKSIGMDLEPLVKSGHLILEWQTGLEIYFDEIADQILSIVRKHDVRRLFIDGVCGLSQAMIRPERLKVVLNALAHELRALNVTTVFTEEVPLFEKSMLSKLSDHSGVTDNIIVLHHVEYQGRLASCISITKTRGSSGSRFAYILKMTDKGLRLGDVVEHLNPRLPSLRQSNALLENRQKQAPTKKSGPKKTTPKSQSPGRGQGRK